MLNILTILIFVKKFKFNGLNPSRWEFLYGILILDESLDFHGMSKLRLAPLPE